VQAPLGTFLVYETHGGVVVHCDFDVKEKMTLKDGGIRREIASSKIGSTCMIQLP
jgi:hypothetical protein